MAYCIYLRKSRSDDEAEQKGEEETLERHKKNLLELAGKLKLPITQIHHEVKSGETIAARPVMQKLLNEVEQGAWDGVLVMEVERLARGDTIDQGIVAQAFKYTNTKIITPTKTYDPNNEYDEEYFEFGLFMSRREYKTINRRLQHGRMASINEGKYVGNKEPYGYRRVKIDKQKGFTLAVDSTEAEIIKLMFEYYTIGKLQSDGSIKRLGTTVIADCINDLGVTTSTGKPWTAQAITSILRNPVYIGKIKWGARPGVKSVVNGEIILSRPRRKLDEITLFDGLHDSIIDMATWTITQEQLATNSSRTVPNKYVVKNPLSGVIVCGLCGKKMVRRPYKDYADTLMCATRGCPTVCAPLASVEKALLNSLALYLEEYNTQLGANKIPELHQDKTAIKFLQVNKTELAKLQSQSDSLHDLLEQGVYSTETFLKRSKAVNDKVIIVTAIIQDLENQVKEDESSLHKQNEIIPKIKKVLQAYWKAKDNEQKNDLLKSVITKAVYNKSVSARWQGSPDDFTLSIMPKN